MKKKNSLFPIYEKVEILDVGSDGKAVARVNDLVIFVPFAIPGDIADIQIVKRKRSYREGKIIRFHHYSDQRVTAFCPHFGICGGCRWQNLEYEAQLFYKHKQVAENLKRIGKFQEAIVLPILASPLQKEYRNKLEYTFSNRRWFTEPLKEGNEMEGDRNALGFHIPTLFDRVLDIQHCSLQPEPTNEIRLFLRSYAIRNQLSFYDVRNWTGLLRNLIIRNTTQGEWMVIVVFREDEKAIIHELMNALSDSFPEITSLYYVINPKKNDVINDLNPVLFKGKSYITEKFPSFSGTGKEMEFRIGPVSFFQTNSFQAINLYRKVAEYAEFKGNETVYDLYTGTGTIANYIAPQVRQVIGIEAVEAAIADALTNARINGIENIQFYAGEAEHLLTPDFIARDGSPDVVITDPPRSGMHEKVILSIMAMAAEKIIYVSCNPATQARDLALLSGQYELILSQPLDMFPHTQHVENIALLKRKV